MCNVKLDVYPYAQIPIALSGCPVFLSAPSVMFNSFMSTAQLLVLLCFPYSDVVFCSFLLFSSVP